MTLGGVVAVICELQQLGAARADHLAVALPFEDLANSTISHPPDHNHYPRAALLDAIVRVIEQDMVKSG